MEVTFDNDLLSIAMEEGALTALEAFGLMAFLQADEDEEIPPSLYDAVERLYLWSTETQGLMQ